MVLLRKRTTSEETLQDRRAQARTDVPSAQRNGEDVPALLGMYDEMADLLEASPEDCEALAYGLSSIINAGAPRVHQLIHAGHKEGQPPLGAAQHAAATAAVDRIGKAMEAVLPRCSQQLLPELRHMNELAAALAH